MSEPQSFSYRPLPKSREETITAWREMREILRKGGATFFRYTFFDDEFPSEIYPHGLYLEGWDSSPKEQCEFNFPMTIIPSSPNTGDGLA